MQSNVAVEKTVIASDCAEKNTCGFQLFLGINADRYSKNKITRVLCFANAHITSLLEARFYGAKGKVL